MEQNRSNWPLVGFEGAIALFAPLPCVVSFASDTISLSNHWPILFGSISSFLCILFALTFTAYPFLAKIVGYAAFIFCSIAAFPYFSSNPFIALCGSIIIIGGIFRLADVTIPAILNSRKNDHVLKWLYRTRWSFTTMPAMVVLTVVVAPKEFPHSSSIAILVSFCIAQLIGARWCYKKRLLIQSILSLIAIPSAVALAIVTKNDIVALFVSATCLVWLFFLPSSGDRPVRREHWWVLLINHPARILLTTFLILCFFGTLLLVSPLSIKTGPIAIIDAAFTSVSAVCVTGLTILDTGSDFTFFGQLFILLLIQLGGLGIMGIATVSLHAMGRRLSITQERILTTVTNPEEQDLIKSLKMIFKFTFITEVAGAFLLMLLFHATGDTMTMAFWRGMFTAVSAFCNAGFSLQSDSIVSYLKHPLILHTIAVLIIMGGMAPATCIMVPRWLSGKLIPVSARLSLITMTVLLITGTFLFLAFEWNGVMQELSLNEKLHNAWFQSVTLRTAGFNSVPLSSITNQSLLFMLLFMFIGGTPGGTAGGIKTTTIGILAITFWTTITNKSNILFRNRQISSQTVYRAITITISGGIIWVLAVIMLNVTQQISARDVIFETMSALGTVGLSIGTTMHLDEIGKIIIMITMFIGRIGPMTIFMLLGNNRIQSVSNCPDAKITLS